ncbi:type 1 glutamine amidotransferase domain-containing protein [Rubrivirga sp. IMCC45206]|uniref:type 1 glutamine amidotransferase domain-containing protein n=1 Tax=Rubrivirga sp. IMCC45206 TaxID=3391614 RepID=UPI00398FE08C
MPALDNTSIAILATNGFEQSELVQPKQSLEDAGATVHVISPESGRIKGWDQKDWGDSVDVDVALGDADPASYAALVLPGGQMNPDVLRANGDAVAFVKAFAEAGKPIAAICHAPWLVIEAGLADGRTATSWPSLRTDLENAGATVVDRSVAVDTDGPFTLITSRKPEDIPDFVGAVVDALSEPVEA